jgi:hypothetical protein
LPLRHSTSFAAIRQRRRLRLFDIFSAMIDIFDFHAAFAFADFDLFRDAVMLASFDITDGYRVSS